MLVLNASPLHLEKQALRTEILAQRVRATGLAAVYANLVGGQDELVFDGASFALDADGRTAMSLPQFEEVLGTVEFSAGRLSSAQRASALAVEAEAYGALVLGVRDYIGKNGFPGAIIGLSGDRFGPDPVRGRRCPGGRPGAGGDDALALHGGHEPGRQSGHGAYPGVRYDEIPIASAMATFDALLAPEFAGLPRHDGGKPPGSHPGHDPHGAFQQDRGAGPDHGQQVGNGRRLRDAVRRHGRGLRSSRMCSKPWCIAFPAIATGFRR